MNTQLEAIYENTERTFTLQLEVYRKDCIEAIYEKLNGVGREITGRIDNNVCEGDGIWAGNYTDKIFRIEADGTYVIHYNDHGGFIDGGKIEDADIATLFRMATAIFKPTEDEILSIMESGFDRSEAIEILRNQN